jgi:DNA repair photolyase
VRALSVGIVRASYDSRNNAAMELAVTEIRNILTRTTGFLKTVTSHSVQPYRGCSFGNALCGVGCYVQHNPYATQGRPWGSFLEVRKNGADSYRLHVDRERRWARKSRGKFGVLLSSSTEPFLPQEFRYRVTEKLLHAMLESPPDLLILQTHSHRVTEYLEIYHQLHRCCDLRVHISIETDIEEFPGLPSHASSVERRFDAARTLKESGIRTVITVSPLMPIQEPEPFFSWIAECADAVVIDHFVQGDGSADGSRTERTALPAAMAAVRPDSVDVGYRDRMVEIAKQYLPGRVGVNIDGFAGRYRA